MRSVAYDQQCSQRGGSARSAKLAYGHTRLPAVAGPAHSRRPSWSFGTVTPFKGVTQQLSINVLRPKVPAAGLIRATADFQRAADTSLQQQEAQLGALLQRTQKVISWHDKVDQAVGSHCKGLDLASCGNTSRRCCRRLHCCSLIQQSSRSSATTGLTPLFRPSCCLSLSDSMCCPAQAGSSTDTGAYVAVRTRSVHNPVPACNGTRACADCTRRRR